MNKKKKWYCSCECYSREVHYNTIRKLKEEEKK